MKEREILGQSPPLNELRLIAQIIGFDFDMNLVLGEPGKGSFFDWRENKITLDPLQFTENPIRVKETVAHEGGHRAISRTQFIPDEIWQEFGFSSLFNTVEDCRVDNWLATKYEGVKNWQNAVFESQFVKEGGQLLTLEAQEVLEKLGYLPRFTQYLYELKKFWNKGKFSANLPSDISQALKETIGFAKKAFQEYPPIFPEESEIDAKARSAYLITRTKIWPIFKRLLEKDLQNEALRQMIREFSNAEKNKGGKGSKREQDQNQKERSQKEQQSEKEISQALKQTKKEERRRKSKEKGSPASQKVKEELNSLLQGERDPLDQLDPSKLSQNLRNRWKRIFEKLPTSEKERFEEQAQETLKGIEDILNLRLRGKLRNPLEHETHQEAKKRKMKEELSDQKEKEITLWLSGVKSQLEQERKPPDDVYDHYYQEILPLIDKTVEELERVLEPNQSLRFKSGFPNGSRLDITKAMQFEADSTIYDKLWQRKTLPQRRDYRFYLLVDLSKTMQTGGKIQETVKGIVFLTEVFQRVSLPFEVAGFSTFQDDSPAYWIYKDFNNNEVDSQTRKSIGRMISHGQGWTPTSEATRRAIDRLNKHKGKNNFLITLTDGLPQMPTDEQEEVKEFHRTAVLLAEAKKKSDIKMIAIKLGQDPEGDAFIQSNYPFYLILSHARELSTTLAKLIEDILKNPMNY